MIAFVVAPLPIAVWKTAIEPPPALLTALLSAAANVIASSTM